MVRCKLKYDDELIDSVGSDCPHPAAPSHDIEENSTGYHRLVEHPQHGTADIEE